MLHKHSTGVGMVLIDQNITSFSASDLVNFTLCPCKVRFTLQNKTTGFPAFVEPDSGKIVQDKGKEHEWKVLEMFREKYSSPVELKKHKQKHTPGKG
jgi:hypothetical protein